MSTILNAATTNDKEAGSIIELNGKQQNVIETSKEDNEEVELSKNEVAMETVEIN